MLFLPNAIKCSKLKYMKHMNARLSLCLLLFKKKKLGDVSYILQCSQQFKEVHQLCSMMYDWTELKNVPL